MNRIPDDSKAVEDDAIKHAVKLQKDVGIKTITDGELRRFHLHLLRLWTLLIFAKHYLRGFFFDGVFNKLEGMVTIPNRKLSLYSPHAYMKGQYILSRCCQNMLSLVKLDYLSRLSFQPYIPHIAMMYAAGVQAAETVFCNVSFHRSIIPCRLGSRRERLGGRSLSTWMNSSSSHLLQLLRLVWHGNVYICVTFYLRMCGTSRLPCVRQHGFISVMGQIRHTIRLCMGVTVSSQDFPYTLSLAQIIW